MVIFLLKLEGVNFRILFELEYRVEVEDKVIVKIVGKKEKKNNFRLIVIRRVNIFIL